MTILKPIFYLFICTSIPYALVRFFKEMRELDEWFDEYEVD